TGALGGFYGARLQRAGAEVHYLLRSDYDHVKQHGLVVESPDGDFILPGVNAYTDAQKMPPCDVVIVALKTTQNHRLASVLPTLTETGVVLVLQNGLGVEAQAAEQVGSDRVLGGLCFLCSNKAGPGHIRHLDYKKIAMGEYRADQSAGGVTDRMEAIAQDFERADIPIERAADLVLARWKKLMWNIPFNGLSVILNATTDAMMGDDNARTLARTLMEEVRQGASSQGRLVPAEFTQTMLDHTAEMRPYRTSMKIDYDEKRPLEVEAMYGAPLRTAQAQGVALPHIETLYHQLKFLDQQNRRG
ncbi:MAG: putative 2-dehydropantoate 2-reductase, partial [Cyanobacteria bacterium J06638_22]